MYNSGEGKGPRVLVVDDDPALRELLTTRLTIAGYEPTAVRNGVEALERIGDVRPVAMILDINMPQMTGFEVLETLKIRGQLAGLRVMVLTARNQPDDVKRAIQLGAHDYLAKPFKDLLFLARMARLVRKKV